jgi:hypothetical protein
MFMLKSARVPERTYAIVMWLVSIVFAGFLIGLGNLVIGDLPQLDQDIRQEQFVDAAAQAKLNVASKALREQRSDLNAKSEDARLKLDQARNTYTSANETFETWIKTRTATVDPNQDPEVIRRTQSLEVLKGQERSAQSVVEKLDEEQLLLSREENDLSQQQSSLNEAGRPAYEKAMFWQDLKVFLWRLAFTLPLLGVAGWLVMKKRKSDYWPLMRGFVIAAVFAFFFELVPYLPSYGGYIRYIVGIGLTLVAGHFIIKNMRAYLLKRQLAEHQVETERRKLVSYEEAFKKMSAKVCPGCDRPVSTTGEAEANFCVHCGMTLFNKCSCCNTRKMAFFRYCMSCGTTSTEIEPAKAV